MQYTKEQRNRIIHYEITIQNHNGKGFLAELLSFVHHNLAIQEKVYWRLEEGPMVQITKIREVSPYQKDEFVYRIDHDQFKYGTEKELIADLEENY